MPKAWFALTILLIMSGCTSIRLKQSTINQAGTLAALQHQQVLNNLAMFLANPEALPSLVNLKDGSAQIADVGSAQYMGDWHRAFKSQPTLLGSRTVVEQWGMTPIVNDIEVQILKLAYRRAAGFNVSLENDRDLTNDLAHELVKQTPDIDDFRGSIANHYENFRNGQRVPFINYFFPSVDIDRFYDETISVVDEQIVWEEEAIALMNIYGKYGSQIIIPGSPYGSPGSFKYADIYDDKDDNIRRQLFPQSGIAAWGNPMAPYYEPMEPYTPISIPRGGPPPDGTRIRLITAEAANARRQVKETERDLLEIVTDQSWYGRGGKHDVPKDACYVAHCGDRYVWVGPDGLKELSTLTIKTLKFEGLIKEQAVLSIPGPRFTPASGFPSL
jgi:hypothetical protein